MTHSINKVRATSSILDAICKELEDDAPIFREHFELHNNPVTVVISEFEKLTYRERTIIGARLGFNPHHDYCECKKDSFLACAIAFEMSCADSASRIFHRSLRELAPSIMWAME